MYLSELKLWNFRKYGMKENNTPGLVIEFKEGLNVLIGENDSGKSAIIDSIRYILNTKSYEQIHFDEKDFYKPEGQNRSNSFEIECLFKFSKDRMEKEAANFLEWAHFNEKDEYELRVHLKATLQSNNKIIWDIKAGPKDADSQLDGNARELLKVTYLKPLRDAEHELSPGYRSRLAQILISHKYFKKEKDENGNLKNHIFEDIIKKANDEIKNKLIYGDTEDKKILSEINKHLKKFLHNNDSRHGMLGISSPELTRILRSLNLELEKNTSGLGSLNKLYMAAELLHIESEENNGLKLCLIEELEAHLHPQAQLRVIKALQDIKDTQIILTTHSTTLGSSIELKHLIICHDNDVFPLWEEKTKLEKINYKFLERFLDATKANLFFARGVILVEGDAENILIPVIADLIGKPLHEYGVSIVNVGSTAFLHYANIFIRKDNKEPKIPVAVVTDLDVRASEYYEDQDIDTKYKKIYKIPDLESFKKTEFSQLIGTVYESKEEIKEEIRNIINTNKLPNGMSSIIDSIEPETINSTLIEKLRETRKNKLEKKINFAPVKVFHPHKWTLEYDISMSINLRIYMEEAIKKAKEIKNKKSYEINFDGFFSEINSNESPEKVAYEIFKPFITNNKPSKAVTAQIFADLLKENNVNKDLLLKDEYIEYIINAINYTCDKQGKNI